MKRKQYARLISKLRNKLEIAEAKEEQLQFEKGALKETVPSEVYVKLKKQFHDLKLRHQKFHHLLQTNFDDLSTVALSTSKVPSAKTLLIAPVSTMTGDIESQFKSNFSIGKQTFELSMLKEHLDEPDQQQKHMEELITLTPDIQSQKGNAATLSGDVDISESDPGDL
ncbi:uncharacterized protein LOC143250579 isoform X2 [Tachypleus tridentatus]|uniref:uncharacterized protein LOC143250579 isoform X2 n=1 Tax=Tachypleus tridentatus TaxID=6853 RepID=UPI003FD14D2F